MPSRESGFYLQGLLEEAAFLYRAGSRERLATQSRGVQAVDEKILSAASGGSTCLQTKASPVLESEPRDLQVPSG